MILLVSDLRLMLIEVVLVPRVAPRYDLGRAHPLADGDLRVEIDYFSNRDRNRVDSTLLIHQIIVQVLY